MKSSNRLLSFLRSNNFALTIAILSVIVQSFHSYTAFYNTSTLKGTAWGMAQAVLFAVIIDLAILFYTVRRRTDIARLAALVMVIINSYYYYQSLGISFEFIFGVFLSLIIPVSVYFYSEEIGKEEIEEGNPYHYARIIEDKDEEIDRVTYERDSAVNSLKISESGFTEKIKEYEGHLSDRLADLGKAERMRDHWKFVADTNKKSLDTLIASDARKVLLVDGKEVELDTWNEFVKWHNEHSPLKESIVLFEVGPDGATEVEHEEPEVIKRIPEIPRTDRPARE